MVRQRPRKSIEELYSTKFDTTPLKAPLPGHHCKNNIVSKTERSSGGDYKRYVFHTTCMPNKTGTLGSTLPTNHRKTARPSLKLDINDEIKKEMNMKAKTTRPDKRSTDHEYDNSFVVYPSAKKQKEAHLNSVHRSNMHHYQQSSQDEDKEDDTEEFFMLIRETVQQAIDKSFSEVIIRNFRELTAKVERLSAELKATTSQLNKLQSEVNKKVVHYGEENSRHFRYLCMKSEYDKMFYQHHTMLTTNSNAQEAAPAGSQKAATPTSPSPPPLSQKIAQEPEPAVPNTCDCNNNSIRKRESSKSGKTSSESLSHKSSEVAMREVLEHIQRFCAQVQMNDKKTAEPLPAKTVPFMMDAAMKLQQTTFFEEDDDDDSQASSDDGMTPRSDTFGLIKCDSGTSRKCGVCDAGAGDARL